MQLRGADEIGAQEEEDAGDAAQGEQQPGGGADDVLRHDHGDGAQAGQDGDCVEQDRGEVSWVMVDSAPLAA